MAKFTYGMLLEQLARLTDEQLAMEVTLYNWNNDNIIVAEDFAISGKEDEQDVRPSDGELQSGQPYMLIDNSY